MEQRTCRIRGCDRPRKAFGLCSMHYQRWVRSGAVILRPRPTPHDRFWEKVNRDGPVPDHAPDLGACWLWMGAKAGKGYGVFRISKPRRMVYAHRFAYELLVGPIPVGLTLDHLCRNEACVNPRHVEPVTSRENTLRGDSLSARRARQTRCKNGHLLDEANTYAWRGRRRCRTCRRAYDRERDRVARVAAGDGLIR